MSLSIEHAVFAFAPMLPPCAKTDRVCSLSRAHHKCAKNSSPSCLSAEPATATHLLLLLLQYVRDLEVDVEEFGGAPVEADGLALVDLALEVVVGDALLCAGLVETIEDRGLALVWDRYR